MIKVAIRHEQELLKKHLKAYNEALTTLDITRISITSDALIKAEDVPCYDVSIKIKGDK